MPLWSVDGAGQRGLSTLSSTETSLATKHGKNWRQNIRDIWSKYKLPALSKSLARNPSKQLNEVGGGANCAKVNGTTIGLDNLWQSITLRLRNWTTFNGQAAKLRNEAAKQLLLGSGRTVPLLSLIGITVLTNDGLLTNNDKMKSLCCDIRMAFSTKPAEESFAEYSDCKLISNLDLNSLKLGDVIAKGCNAIVYAAKWSDQLANMGQEKIRTMSENSDDSGTESSIEVLSAEDEEEFNVNNSFAVRQNVFQPVTVSSPENRSKLETICQPFNGYNLAVKMMFNYEAESNAPAIMQAMYKEIVPSRTFTKLSVDDWEKGSRERKKYLPPHPNIVELNYSFADSVPHLPQAMSLYPDALPRRINQNGAGRNMTLFLIMKRYHCSLQEYLRAYNPPERTRLLLIAQLFEAIVHLVRNEVAHRDLKTDNILLDLSEGLEHPKLVITDFGCCLADERLGLLLPYHTAETSRGGNSALMAPEVACARPGPFQVIDYSKADLWAAGTLAIEILGHPNPFHHGNNVRLDSRSYSEKDLNIPPNMNDSNDPVIWKLISSILQRDPKQRPDVKVVADICSILLFAPKKWTKDCHTEVDEKRIINWLVNFAGKMLIQKKSSLSEAEHQLAITFLKRATLKEIASAVDFLKTYKVIT